MVWWKHMSPQVWYYLKSFLVSDVWEDGGRREGMLQIPNLNFYTVKSDEFTLKTTSQASNFPRSHRATVNLPLVQSPLIYVNAEAASPTVALRPHCATAAFFDFQQIKSSNSFTARSCSSNREACVRALLL